MVVLVLPLLLSIWSGPAYIAVVGMGAVGGAAAELDSYHENEPAKGLNLNSEGRS